MTESAKSIRTPSEGWVLFAGPPLGFPGPVYCRVADVEGVLRVVDLHLSGGDQPVSAAAVRQLPLARMEAAAAAKIRRSDPDDGEAAELDDTDRAVGSWDEVNRWHTWLVNVLFQKVESEKGGGWLTLRDAHTTPTRWEDGSLWIATSGGEGDARFEQPQVIHLEYKSGQRLTDEFLRSVGAAYEAALTRGEPPAKAISDATGAEQKTVQSWLYQGRRRGVIAPAQGKGRIT